jgi:hypothetical protein
VLVVASRSTTRLITFPPLRMTRTSDGPGWPTWAKEEGYPRMPEKTFGTFPCPFEGGPALTSCHSSTPPLPARLRTGDGPGWPTWAKDQRYPRRSEKTFGTSTCASEGGTVPKRVAGRRQRRPRPRRSFDGPPPESWAKDGPPPNRKSRSGPNLGRRNLRTIPPGPLVDPEIVSVRILFS